MNNPQKPCDAHDENYFEDEWNQLQYLEFRKAALNGLLSNPEVFNCAHSNRHWRGTEDCTRLVGCAEAHARGMMIQVTKVPVVMATWHKKH